MKYLRSTSVLVWETPETNKLAVLSESNSQRRVLGCVYVKMEANQELGRVQLASSQLCLIQPFGQNGLQFAGIFKAQLKIFKAADGGLAELGAVHRSESLPYVSLSVACQQDRNTSKYNDVGRFHISFSLIAAVLTQFDPPYLEVIGKHLQFSDLRGVHGRDVFWIACILPLWIGFNLANAGAPGGLVTRQKGRGQWGETMAQRTGATAESMVWKLVETGSQRPWRVKKEGRVKR